jgi:hypothetical protein
MISYNTDMELSIVISQMGLRGALSHRSYDKMVETWIDPNEPIPTLEECETKWNELVSSGFIQRLFEPPYYVKREQAYLDAGITMTRVNELTAEYTFALASNDTELIEKYKTQLDEIQSQRLSIKNQFPKPE